MSDRRRRLLAAVAAAGLLALWRWGAAPALTRLPADFRYGADIFSRDRLYDEREGRFKAEVLSHTRFGYEAVEARGGALTVRSVFDVRKPAGEVIFSVDRLYGVDRRSWRHRPDLGNKRREGWLFAPRGAGRDPFVYWHVNYDLPLTMAFVGEEEILGLKVFHYRAEFKADQTADVGHLPGVPARRGVELDVRLDLWIEPVSGWLVKYEDRAEAWYYDVKTRARLHPWNVFQNAYTEASVADHLRLARRARRRALWAGAWGWAAWALSCLFLLGWSVGWRGRVSTAASQWLARNRSGARWVALFAGAGGLCFLFVLYCALKAREDLQVLRSVSAEAEQASGRVADRMEDRLLALSRMARRWEDAGGTPKAAWEKDAARFVEDYAGFYALSWVDASARVRWIVPMAGNESVRGVALTFEASRRSAMEEARRTGNITITKPVDLMPNGRGFLVFIPLTLKDGRFDGFITGVFRFDQLIDVLVREIAAQGHGVGLYVGEEEVYRRGPRIDKGGARTVEKPVEFRGAAWRLVLSPRAVWADWARSSLPEATLAAGLAVLALGALCLALGWEAARRAVLLQKERDAGLAREARFRAFLEAAPDAVVIADAAGRIVLANAQAERMFGYPRAELVGLSVGTLVPDRLRPGVEAPARRKDGTEFPVEISLSPMAADEGMLAISAIRDVTERRETQKALTAHAEELKRQRAAALNLARDAQEARLKAEAAESRIARSLKEKESLLQEIHHRVKNNMQVVSSLLRLQSEKVRDEEALKVLKDSQRRVHAMAMLHENLYKSGDLGHVDFREYLGKLSTELSETHGRPEVSIRTEADIGGVDIERAVPLGLIINELVTNAYKHAFPGGRGGTIRVSLSRSGGDGILAVSDDGVGIPEAVLGARQDSLGLHIVDILSRQLRGKPVFRRAGGTEFRLSFPL